MKDIKSYGKLNYISYMLFCKWLYIYYYNSYMIKNIYVKYAKIMIRNIYIKYMEILRANYKSINSFFLRSFSINIPVYWILLK